MCGLDLDSASAEYWQPIGPAILDERWQQHQADLAERLDGRLVAQTEGSPL